MLTLKFLRHAGAPSIVLLGAGLVYVSRENVRLQGRIAALVASQSTAFSACVLPSLRGRTHGGALSLNFPRSRPVLLLVSDKHCRYCDSALTQWKQITNRFPWAEGFVCDRKASYGLAELKAASIDPNLVWIAIEAASPYAELFSVTPAVILVGRTGSVLGVWRGELGAKRVHEIVDAIETTLM